MVKSLRKNLKSSFGKKKMTGGAAAAAAAAEVPTVLSDTGLRTMERFYRDQKKKYIVFITDPSYGGSGDVDDYLAYLLIRYFCAKDNMRFYVYIGGDQQKDRLENFKMSQFYNSIQDKYTPSDQISTLDSIKYTETDSNGETVKYPTFVELESKYNVLYIVNSPVSPKFLDFLFSKEDRNYMFQGYNYKDDFNISETIKHLDSDFQGRHQQKIRELGGISSISTRLEIPTTLLPSIYGEKANIIGKNLRKVLDLKKIGMSICVSEFFLKRFGRGFFALDESYKREFIKANYTSKESESKENERKEREIRDTVFHKIYGTSSSGGKGNNIRFILQALIDHTMDTGKLIDEIQAVGSLKDAHDAVINEAQEVEPDQKVFMVFSEGLKINIKELEKLFPAEEDDQQSQGIDTSLKRFSFNNLDPSLKGFIFILKTIYWLVGEDLRNIFIFDPPSPLKLRPFDLNNAELKALFNTMNLITDTNKIKFRDLLVKTSPPLWDAIAVIYYFDIFPSRSQITEEYCANVINNSIYVNDQYIGRTRSLENPEQTTEEKRQRSLLRSLSTPPGMGGKRTNKKLRKNKKHSLRKMKGGSKKANQKKLKLRKSRKA